MRNISITTRQQLSQQESGEDAICLLTIWNPEFPPTLHVSSHPTQLYSEGPDGYGTNSRGTIFRFVPFSIVMPDDQAEKAPTAQLQIENITRDLIPLVRMNHRGTKIKIEITTTSNPNIVEVDFPALDITDITYDAMAINIQLGLDSLATEPYPAGKYTAAHFPGLY